MIPASLAELLEAGARQEEALRTRDLDAALLFGEARERACRRLAAEMEAGSIEGRLGEGDLAGGLRRARAANLRSLRLARSIARDIRRELDSVEDDVVHAGAGAGMPAASSRAAEPRFLDRRG